MADSIRIGGGSAYVNDRRDAAVALAERGGIDAMLMDMLAERTLAMLQSDKRQGKPGYWPSLDARFRELLPVCARNGVKLLTNGGGAAPRAAAELACRIARERGLAGLKVAYVGGDDVTELVKQRDPVLLETGRPLSHLQSPVICANAYLGATAIAAAIRAGADVVVTGRVTDSALAVGPAMAKLGWREDDAEAMAAGVLAGHLLECGAQATGGYFAEPGLKEVPGMEDLGFPIAELHADRSITVSKTPGTGGRVDRHTVIEQMLYEMHDPSAYLTPDATLDVTGVEVTDDGPDRVRLTGVRGRPAPDTLKVLVGIDNGWLAEAEMSYCGINADARVALAAEIVARRVARDPELKDHPLRIDRIGVDSLWPGEPRTGGLRDVRLRVAARLPSRETAERLINEVDALYVNGPAGGGGGRSAMRATIRTVTAFLPRSDVPPEWQILEA